MAALRAADIVVVVVVVVVVVCVGVFGGGACLASVVVREVVNADVETVEWK